MADKKATKRPRWETEKWIGEHPDPGKIQCSKCTLREADRKLGSTVIQGATLGLCKGYKSKPYAVLFKGAKCDKFEQQ